MEILSGTWIRVNDNDEVVYDQEHLGGNAHLFVFTKERMTAYSYDGTLENNVFYYYDNGTSSSMNFGIALDYWFENDKICTNVTPQGVPYSFIDDNHLMYNSFRFLKISKMEQRGNRPIAADYSPETSTTRLWPAATISKNSEGYDKASMGYIDEKGNFAIPSSYQEAYSFSCGYALVRVSEKSIYFIDEKNNIQNAPDFQRAGRYFYYDYVRYMTSSELWGMLNKNFEIVIQPAYVALGNMSSDGLVAFKQSADGKYGYLNAKGDVVISPMYDYAYTFDQGYAVVRMGENYGVINKSGEFTVGLQSSKNLYNLGAERIGFKDATSGKFGMMDAKGNIIVQAIYDDGDGIGFTDGDLMVVYSNDKAGYMDKNGKMKIAQQFYRAEPFADGKAWVKRTEESNYEVIDESGKSLLTLGKGEVPAELWRQGLCLVYKYDENGYEYKYINEKGSIVYSWKLTGVNYAPAKKANGKLDFKEMIKATKWGYRIEE